MPKPPKLPQGMPTPAQVLDFIQSSSIPAGKREIAKAFGLKGQEKIKLKALLKDMAEEGLIDGKKSAFHRMGGVPKVTVDAAVRTDTELRWPDVSGAQKYRVQVRRPDEPYWRAERPVGSNGEDWSRAIFQIIITDAGNDVGIEIPLRGDDWLFGVQACAGEYCSPVSSAVPGGAFEPVGKK